MTVATALTASTQTRHGSRRLTLGTFTAGRLVRHVILLLFALYARGYRMQNNYRG